MQTFYFIFHHSNLLSTTLSVVDVLGFGVSDSLGCVWSTDDCSCGFTDDIFTSVCLTVSLHDTIWLFCLFFTHFFFTLFSSFFSSDFYFTDQRRTTTKHTLLFYFSRLIESENFKISQLRFVLTFTVCPFSQRVVLFTDFPTSL